MEPSPKAEQDLSNFPDQSPPTINRFPFVNSITLLGATSLSTGSGAGDITLPSLDGNFTLSLTAGTGDIIFNGDIGDTTPLDVITVQSVGSITYPETQANGIVQNGSTGTTTITGPISTFSSTGVSITGDIITQNGMITTQNTGPLTFNNSGLLTINAASLTDGAFTQSGIGSVDLGAMISTTNESISFASAIALTADVSITTSPSDADITFSGAITVSSFNALCRLGRYPLQRRCRNQRHSSHHLDDYKCR